MLLSLGVKLKFGVRDRETVVVPVMEEFADCEAAVDTLEDLEVLLDWEGEVVYVVLALALLLVLGVALVDEVKQRVTDADTDREDVTD